LSDTVTVKVHSTKLTLMYEFVLGLYPLPKSEALYVTVDMPRGKADPLVKPAGFDDKVRETLPELSVALTGGRETKAVDLFWSQLAVILLAVLFAMLHPLSTGASWSLTVMTK